MERQQLIWKERHVELKVHMYMWNSRYPTLLRHAPPTHTHTPQMKVKALKARKKEVEDAPWADMIGDLGNGQVWYGCMDAWVHGCMGAWVYGCMGAWVHR